MGNFDNNEGETSNKAPKKCKVTEFFVPTAANYSSELVQLLTVGKLQMCAQANHMMARLVVTTNDEGKPTSIKFKPQQPKVTSLFTWKRAKKN